VSYNRFYNTPIGIKNLENLRTRFGCDIITHTPDIRDIKLLIAACLNKMGSFHWPNLAGETVFPVQTSVRLKIPLIIWGANQGLDQVGMFSHYDFVEMTRRYRREHDLLGFEAEDLVDSLPDFTEKRLFPYFYPQDKTLREVGTRGIYLNNFFRWDSKAQHEKMMNWYGYLTKSQEKTFNHYEDVHCSYYSNVHDYIKYCKWGYGKVQDHVAREIRLKRLSHDAALRFIKLHRHLTPPPQMSEFLGWIGWSLKEFQDVIDEHRDPSAWERKNGAWHSKSALEQLLNNIDPNSLINDETMKFIINTTNKDSENNSGWYHPLLIKGKTDDRKIKKMNVGKFLDTVDFNGIM